jgi:ATP-binding cassette, subfamily B, bacterial
MAFVHQTLTAIPIVQAFATEDRNRKHFQHLATDAVALAQRRALVNSSYGMVNGFVTTAGAAFVLYVGGLRVLEGTLPLGTLLVYVAYIQTLQSAAEGLLKIYSNLKPVEASMDRILEVLDVDDAVHDAPGAKPLAAQATNKGRHLRLAEVTFGYEPGRPALQGVTLEARPGETVALVGCSGAGKSTVASLILRSFDPWEGRVLLDGMDLRDIQLSSLRSQVAIMLQEALLLPLSVADNIAYGRPTASREEIVAAAVAANADEFIRRLPEGYATLIGERGANLSGGQRQRIAIARALLKDAPVLILDEPTSALDVHSEAAVMDALERLMEGRTSLIIAHRLSTIRRADRIVMLDRGRVVEEGVHAELLAARGVYHRFYALQSEESVPEVVA